MSNSGRRVVKVPSPKSTNSHSLKMKDPISSCSVSISLFVINKRAVFVFTTCWSSLKQWFVHVCAFRCWTDSTTIIITITASFAVSGACHSIHCLLSYSITSSTRMWSGIQRVGSTSAKSLWQFFSKGRSSGTGKHLATDIFSFYSSCNLSCFRAELELTYAKGLQKLAGKLIRASKGMSNK